MSAENRRILIIDDERPILMTLAALLGRHSYEPEVAANASTGMRLLEAKKPALVLLDLQLPDADGLHMLEQIKASHPDTQVIILTAHDSLSNAIESIKRGAYHFISKPYAPEELLSLVEKALEKQELLRETIELRETAQRLQKKLAQAETRLAPVFNSKAMQEIDELISAMAPSEANVLITGESGVGKEVIANVIHSRSRRADKPMVKLNCAAFPQAMIEGELFGYVKGAFTGAANDFRGMIAEAEGSTLFLDEISEMPAELQTRFLRVLQEREFRPLGSTKTLKANFRVVAATNRPVQEALAENRLRSDLYYRLNTFQVALPALRERKEDIPPLVSNFVKRFAEQLGKPEPTITPEAFQKLLDYGWPGNVRELQNVMERAAVLVDGHTVMSTHLPDRLQALADKDSTSAEAGSFKQAKQQAVETFERNFLLDLLKRNEGHMSRAAREAGVDRKTIERMVKKHGLRGTF